MDAARLRDRVGHGLGRAAARIGRACVVYRPFGGGNPLVNANRIAETLAAFTTEPGLSFARPEAAQPARYGLIDHRGLAVGDYLVCDGRTYFVETLPDTGPPLCVACNRVLTVKRPDGGAAGASYYGGDVRSLETTLLTSWPAWVGAGSGEGTRHEAGLPGDIGAPMWTIMLPRLPTQVRASDVAEDEQSAPMRYVFGAVQQDEDGVTIRARLGVT